jgi:hypothetical protein
LFPLSERKKDLRLIEKQTFGLQNQTPICQQFKSLHFYLSFCSAIFIYLFNVCLKSIFCPPLCLPSGFLSVSLSVIFDCLSVCFPFCLFSFLSVFLSVCFPFCSFDCLTVCFPFSFSVCLPVCFPVYLFVFPINYLSVLMFFCCLSVYVHCLCSLITIQFIFVICFIVILRNLVSLNTALTNIEEKKFPPTFITQFSSNPNQFQLNLIEFFRARKRV